MGKYKQFFARAGQNVIVSALCLVLAGSQFFFLLAGSGKVFADPLYPELISKTSDGTPGTGDSAGGSSSGGTIQISGDGRYVAFTTGAPNIAEEAGGSLSGAQIYVKDRQTGQVQLGSASSTGEPFDSIVLRPKLSGNGRHVAMVSSAKNLSVSYPPGGTLNTLNYFIKNLDTGEVIRANQGSGNEYVDLQTNFPIFLSNDGNIAVMSGLQLCLVGLASLVRQCM
jgi:hypothetical protein